MIFFLIPVYNEAANIPNLFRQLNGLLQEEDRFFVFSDDGSIDGSREMLKDYFKDIPHTVLGDGTNYGPGQAFNTGFEWILANSKNENDQVVTMEADCTSDESILPTMILLNRMGFELVLASVYAQGGGFDKTSVLRKLLSAFANLLFRFIFDIKVLTLSSFYRVYSLALLKRIKQRTPVLIREKGFICKLEILLKAIRCRATVIEVPMKLHSAKRVGKSKMKILRTSFTYFKFLLKAGK